MIVTKFYTLFAILVLNGTAFEVKELGYYTSENKCREAIETVELWKLGECFDTVDYFCLQTHRK